EEQNKRERRTRRARRNSHLVSLRPLRFLRSLFVTQIAVAGAVDERSEDRLQKRGARCRQTHGDWRSDHTAKRAIESVFGLEFPAAPRRELIVNARPAVGQRAKRGLRGEFAAANGEPQSVASHRIDKAGGIAGEEQAVRRRYPGGIDRQRTDDRRGGHEPCARKS